MPKREPTTFQNEIKLDGVIVRLGWHTSIFLYRSSAREWLEQQRWKGRPSCPHCSTQKVYRSKRGRFRCSAQDCRKDFTVTTGTIMERTHIPLHKLLVAFYLMASGYTVRAEDLRWALGLTYRSAWILWRRIYDVMPEGARQRVAWGRVVRTRTKPPKAPSTVAEMIAAARATTAASQVPPSRPVPPNPYDFRRKRDGY